MTPQELFVARLDAFEAACDNAESAIKSTNVVNPKLNQRAAPELLRRIGVQREKILGQRSSLNQNHFNEGSWNLLHAHEEESSTLFGECLAFLQAARARGHDVDADLCEIADALLDELAGSLTNIDWRRFTVLATEEFFRDLAQIIRLRFPFPGVWDLPVAAHEFGHFVAPRLNPPNHGLPFLEYKESFKKQHADLGDEWMFYLEEYFADVFATYALGPAYACTSLLLRFDPASAQDEKDKRHPSYVKRAYAILQTLRRMNSEKDSKGHFKNPTEILAGWWDQMLASAGQTAVRLEDKQALIDGIVYNFYEMLKSGAPGARFNRWQVAVEKCIWLRTQPPANVMDRDFKLSDLLNAAWLCRSESGADIRRLNANVIQLSRLHTV